MGGDLKYWLAQHKQFDFARSQYYAARTILGLKALHEHNFVYRDIKPENMLVDESGRIKLSDLGLACRVHSELKGASGTVAASKSSSRRDDALVWATALDCGRRSRFNAREARPNAREV